ncbi:MAG: DUF4350 domain-containing protein [Actinomycetota bacterium]|nr:DUF4350 domain-containing protein [Actinomycetota bacterium]
MNAAGIANRNRTPVLIALGVLVLLVGVAWLQRDSAQFAGPLDPRNPRQSGAQAVARVLGDHGVDVSVVRDQASFLHQLVDQDTTVVVTNPDDLGSGSLARLRQHGARAGAIMLVGPSAAVFDAFAVEAGTVPAGDVAAHCGVPFARGLTLRVPSSAAVVGSGCFHGAGAVLLHQAAKNVWLFTAPEVLSNDRVLAGDNAALAVRLLGQHPRVVWYVANLADTSASDAVSISTLLPRWLYPSLWVVGLGVLGFLIWRSRRLGPLVHEPLPVVIRAAESTESRGRLYRKTRDRDHSGAILRRATRRRLADRLALPGGDALVPDLAVAVAQRSGRDLDAIHRLLSDAPVPNDSALAELGRELLRLEAEVPR